MMRASRITLTLVALAAAVPATAEDAPTAGREAAHEAVRAALLERATLPPSPPEAGAATARAAEQLRVRREEEERAAHERAAAHARRHSGETRLGHGAGPSTPGAAHGGDGAGCERGMYGGMEGHDPAHEDRTRGMHDGDRPHDGGPHR